MIRRICDRAYDTRLTLPHIFFFLGFPCFSVAKKRLKFSIVFNGY